INSLCGEGPTSDSNETCLYYQDPISNHKIGIPNSSGTFAVDGLVTATATDGMIRIYNATEGWGPKTMSGDASITNAGVVSMEAGTDGQMFIYNTVEAWGPKTLSGDATITNAGVVSLEAGTDGQLFLYNTVEAWGPKTMSGDATITNAGVVSLEAGTDGQIFIYNTVETWGPKTMSGDATISNSGTLTIGANKIGVGEAFLNTVSLIINAYAVTNSVAVEAGSYLIGTQPVSGITNDTVITRSIYTGTNWHVDINGAGEGGTDVIVNGVFFRP
ncbi:MAG: hypothetical protein ACXABY_27810, partial [Candidatus Thorarchaeota archaeon]